MEVRPGYKQAGAGMIPVEWTEGSLLDLAERRKDLFDDGDWVEAEYLTSEGVRLVQTGNIGVGEFIEKENKKYISPESFAKLRCKDLNVADILICRLAEPAGRACILPDLGEGRVITAVDVTIFRPPTHVADRNFLVNVFSTSQWFREVNDRCGGSTRTRISRGELGKIVVQLPPLPEQRAIAATLSDVDALLDGLDRLIAKKRGLKQAAMQQLLTGKTRLPGFQGGWDLTSLSELCEMKSGEGITSADIDSFSIYPCYGGNGLRGYTSRFTHDGNFALIGRQGALCGNVVEISGRFFASEHAVVVTPNSRTDIRWLTYLLATMNLNQHSESSAQPGLSVSKILMLDVDVPPSKAEQIAIAATLSDMDAELAALEARRDKTRALKQGMMQELLTGRTRLV